MTEPKDLTGDLSGLDRYMRRLYGQEWFPKVDENGLVYLPGKPGLKGKQALKERRTFRAEPKVEQHLKQHFQQRAIHTVSEPEFRARLHKSGGQQTIFGKALNSSYSAVALKKAASEFEVPSHTRMLIVFPDIFDRDILLQHKQFRHEFTDKETLQKLVGVKTPCPWCGTNKFVHVDGKTGQREGAVRTIACYRTRIPIFAGIAKCSNLECSGNPNDPRQAGDDSDKVTVHTFQLNTAKVWQSYPPELRECYAPLMFTEAADGDKGQIFVSEDLCNELLKDDVTLSRTHRAMQESFQRHKTRAMAAYARFMELEKLTVKGPMSWPEFNSSSYDKIFAPPGYDKLSRVFDSCFDLIYTHLQRDLFSRSPGKCIKWDGTYDFAKKTKNDPLAEEEINVLCILFGQFGHIVSFAFAEGEGSNVYQRMNYFLKQRCDRLGTSHEVKFAVSDVCCEGLRDPAAHWVVGMWPGVERAPYKDLMHGQKKVFEATRGATHELHLEFTADIRDKCLLWDAQSQRQVFKHYCKQEKQPSSMTPLAGIPMMMKKKNYRKKIINYIPKPDTHAKSIEQAWESIEQRDNELRAECQAQNKPYKSYVRKPFNKLFRGTKHEVENMCVHIRRGCYCYPLPPHEMSIKVDTDDPFSDLLRLASTSQGESGNKQINKVTRDIGQQSAERGHKLSWLRITRFNLDKDKKFAKVLGIKTPRTMEWFIHEALLHRHPDVFGSAYGGMEFPAELPQGYFEPMGIDYGRYKEWEQIEQLIAEAQIGDMDSPLPQTPPQATESAPAPAADLSPSPAPVPTEESTPAPVPAPALESSPVLESASPLPSMPSRNLSPNPSPTKGDIYSAQANWSRKLGGISQVSYFNTYLLQSKPLSSFQSNNFWALVDEVQQVYGVGSHTPQSHAEQVAHAWNTLHAKMLQHSVMGLGGLMRSGHAGQLLKDRGHEIRHESSRKRALELPPPPAAAAPPSQPTLQPTTKFLEVSGVATLSARDCVPWLAAAGLTIYVGGIKEKRERLLDYFAAKPTGHKLKLK